MAGSAREAMLDRLQAAGEEVALGESKLSRAKRTRDDEVRRASELGLSRRDVAKAVGLTAGGVQRILGQD